MEIIVSASTILGIARVSIKIRKKSNTSHYIIRETKSSGGHVQRITLIGIHPLIFEDRLI